MFTFQFSSVSRSVVSDSLWPQGMQHVRPPCLSLTSGVYSNSCPLSWWCHPTISSSVIPFSSCLHSSLASGSFPMSQFFASDGQSIGASASVLPMNIQDWFPLGLTGWISLQSNTLKSLLQHYSSKASILWQSAFLTVQLSHPYMTTGKTTALTRWTCFGKVMSLLLNMLSRLVIAFFQGSSIFFSWLQSPSAVILEPKKIKSATVSTVSPSVCHEVMGLDAMILVFCMLSFKPAFSLFSFTFISKLFSSSSLSAVFLPAILIPICASSSPHFACCTLHIKEGLFLREVRKEIVPVLGMIRDWSSHFAISYGVIWASQVGLVVKNTTANVGDKRDAGWIPGSGRFPGGGHDNPLQCSCLEKPMDRAVWQATVHRLTKSQARLSNLIHMVS